MTGRSGSSIGAVSSSPQLEGAYSLAREQGTGKSGASAASSCLALAQAQETPLATDMPPKPPSLHQIGARLFWPTA